METGVELREGDRPARLTPTELAKLDHPTPYLLMDLDAVDRAYGAFNKALPDITIRYAVKCNPEERILRRLHAAGSAFEIASCTELQLLASLGVRAEDLIFSNPIKPWKQIQEAARAGVWRFAFDSASELDKLAEHAPGAAVYVRLSASGLGSEVPSEGKFGVGAGQAVELMLLARSLGLQPYGIAYHVGSQMTNPVAWEVATRESAVVMRALEDRGINLRLLNIGGGFPARYADPVPDLSEYGACIRQAIDRHHLLSVHLLGQLKVRLDDAAVDDWPSGRGRSLLKYLVTHRDPWPRREQLMDAFWPEASPAAARNSLNVAVHGLRRAFRAHASGPVVALEDGAYRLAPGVRLWLDVDEFEQHVAGGRRLEATGDLAGAAAEYERALGLYQGDFLADDPYEEWPGATREHLLLAYLDVLDRLSGLYFGQHQYGACVALCRLLVARDPCREDGHRRLMRCFTRQGQPHLALRQYQACADALARDLGVDPDPATAELAQRIRRRQPV